MRLPLFLFGLLMPLSSWAATATQPAPTPASSNDWPSAEASALGWQVQPLAALQTAIEQGTYPGVTSVLVVHRGTLVYERYFGSGGVEVLNDTRSATKSVTALLVGAAIDRGLIKDVSTPVFGLLPNHRQWQHPDPRKQAITVEDLLTMSSLLECDDENQFSSGNEERMYVSEDWTQFVLNLPIKGFAPWMTAPAQSPHGRAFAYCTAGSYLLGAVLEQVSGRGLGDFAAEVLEQPLGITRSHWNRSPLGVGMGGGGTRYRSRDLAKLGQLMLNGGRWQGRQVLSREWTEAALSVHAQAREDADYGYQFWRFRFTHQGQEIGAWAMSGNGGNYVFIVPQEQLVAVVTRTSYNQRGVHQQTQQIFSDYLLKALP